MSIQRARPRLIITLVFIVVATAENFLSLFSEVSGMSTRSCFAPLIMDMSAYTKFILFYIDFTQTVTLLV